MIDSHMKPKCVHGSAVGLRKVRYRSSLKEKIPDAMGTKTGNCGKNTREWKVIWTKDIIDKQLGDSCVEAGFKHRNHSASMLAAVIEEGSEGTWTKSGLGL